MAKKAELLEKATELKLEVSEKNTIAEIEAAIEAAGSAPVETEETQEEKAAAKAGKRSEKAQRETAEKLEKEARKEAGDTTPQSDDAEARVKKGPKPITRSRLERRGKNYRKVA